MRGRMVTAVLLTVAVVAGGALAVRGDLGGSSTASTPGTPGTSATPSGTGSSAAPLPSGDGAGVSSTDQPQTGLPPITRLAEGQRPPQFVVVSFDGACKDALWKHYLALAAQTDSHFTFFLSGLCLLRDGQRFLYHPPHKPVGTSAIGFGQSTLIPQRVEDLAAAYRAGDEIGTHFLGHFCDAQGVGTWSSADWTSEITQARDFLDRWAEIDRMTSLGLTLPFDSHVWKGARTPCLEGRSAAMYPVWQEQGFDYDASRPGSLVWPRRIPGYSMWEFPLQRIKVVGYDKTNLSMDYNLLYVQNHGRMTAPASTCARIQTSTYQSLMQALSAVEHGNHAPFFVGNHFNDWVCDAYRNALTRFVLDAHTRYPGIEFVTFDWLARWLAAQDPSVLRSLQRQPAPRY